MRIRSLFLAAFMFLSSACSTVAHAPAQPVCRSTWMGEINSDFIEGAVKTIKMARGCQVLRVQLLSEGGSVIAAMELVREIENAKQSMVVEIHGRSLIASAATLVLGSGSKGYRYIHKQTLTIVHGIKAGMMGCISYNPEAKTEDERAANAVIELLLAEYMKVSGRSIEEVASWLDCGNSQVGKGPMLVKLGLADHVEG